MRGNIMDWRNRSYYIVHFSYDSKNMRERILRIISDTIKFYPPYGHFAMDEYDGIYRDISGVSCPNYIISCDNSDATAIEYELNKAVRRDNHSRFCKLTKEMLGQ